MRDGSATVDHDRLRNAPRGETSSTPCIFRGACPFHTPAAHPHLAFTLGGTLTHCSHLKLDVDMIYQDQIGVCHI